MTDKPLYYQMLINGEWVDAASGETFEVTNPANSEVVARVPKAGPEDAQRALEAADAAFASWSRMWPGARAAILHRAAQLAWEQQELLGRLLTMEQGKPLKEAIEEVHAAADALAYYAEEAVRITGQVFPTKLANRRSLVLKQPVGVVVAIGPWNYPVLLLFWKIAPALAAGCTVVAKPPSVAPIAVTQFIGLLHEAGAPAGVINVVTGSGEEVGAALVTSPLCRKIGFTGQTETGKKVMAMAADGLKRLSLELGNSAPFIVDAEVDLDLTVRSAVYRSFRNMGQICNAVNRIYVHKNVFDPFVSRFVDRTQALRIGNGLDPDVDLGPMATKAGLEKTQEHIRDAVAKGARILCGGKPPAGEAYARGLFFEPTVLVDVNHSMKVMYEETFGPVAPIMAVDSLDQAIEFANDTPYGLVAYLFSNDLAAALKAAERLEYGTVGINNVSGGEVFYPYGGWKESGFGVELSHQGIEEYLLLKHIRVDLPK